MKMTDVRNATHVKVGDTMHEICETWGIAKDGSFAKPSEGGFGVITTDGQRIDMFTANSYWTVLE